VLPPVSKLTEEQTRYYFLSGYTAKVAGTERGIKEPVPSFSACFGAAFLLLNPLVYAKLLTDRMREHNAKAWLINTGWMGGPYGTGKRIDLPSTRKIINAILNNTILNEEYITIPVFDLQVPKRVSGVETKLLDPGKVWVSEDQWEIAAKDLARKFIDNFKRLTSNKDIEELVKFGPQI
jgi:phosphoenolpyruvate carboxykinase (ATP)